jgi:hypothetical protein
VGPGAGLVVLEKKYLLLFPGFEHQTVQPAATIQTQPARFFATFRCGDVLTHPPEQLQGRTVNRKYASIELTEQVHITPKTSYWIVLHHFHLPSTPTYTGYVRSILFKKNETLSLSSTMF